MIIALSLLVCFVGALMFGLCANGALKEMGRIMFFCGLLAFLLVGLGPFVTLFSGGARIH